MIMKKSIFFLLFATLLGCFSCYDDGDINDKYNKLAVRVTALETLCTQFNANITNLRTTVAALQEDDYVSSITPIVQQGVQVGYIINFTQSDPVIIYHGVNGTNGTEGQDGTDGKDGQDGTDGEDGITPIIGVRLHTDGNYYWTLNGSWLLDDELNMIRATGETGATGAQGETGATGATGSQGETGPQGPAGQDGTNGQDGQDGQDGITPQLKIEDGYWFLSIDNGSTWTNLGQATGDAGQDGDSFFQSVTETDEAVILVLADGTNITLKKQLPLDITFSENTGIGIFAGDEKTLSYTVTGNTEQPLVKAIAQNGWKVKVTPATATTGSITVTAPDSVTDDEIIVLVYDGEYRTIMSCIDFTSGVITVTDDAVVLPLTAGDTLISITSNMNYTISIPEEAQTWLSIVETKAMQTKNIRFAFTENTSRSRHTTVQILDEKNREIETIGFIQDGTVYNINVETAGTLSAQLTEAQISHLSGLEISGSINGTDIAFIRSLSQLKTLNLLASSIVEGGDPYYQSYTTQQDTISTAMFADLANLEEIFIPNGIQYVGPFAFSNCAQLTTVELVNAKIIGRYAFADCPLLTHVQMSEVTDIRARAFSNCTSLANVSIPATLSLDTAAFNECSSLSLIDMPSITTIGRNVFYHTALSVVDLPYVTSLGASAFYNCPQLEKITLPMLVELNPYTFCDCTSLIFVGIPQVTSINNACFYNCSSLSTIDIPLVTNIGYGAFQNCSKLSQIELPSITMLSNVVFQDCFALTSIKMPPISMSSLFGTNIFAGTYEETENYIYKNATLYVPAASLDDYTALPEFGRFTNIITY